MYVTLATPAATEGEVRFTSPDGDGVATWMGDPQQQGTLINVELDIRDDVDWAYISIEPPRVEVFRLEDNQLTLSGVVRDIDPEGVLTLHIGQTALLVDTTGTPPPDIVGQSVIFAVRHVRLYPTGI